MALSGRGPDAYYHQISSILREQIAGRQFIADECLPSEEQLQAMFVIWRTRARQALQVLERDGLIDRLPGKGFDKWAVLSNTATRSSAAINRGFISLSGIGLSRVNEWAPELRGPLGAKSAQRRLRKVPKNSVREQ